jgi:hypothetical protein
MTRLSCHRFRSNEVRLWLSVIAYDLGDLWRQLLLPQKISNWSLTSLQQRLVKHARCYWLLLAEGHPNRRLVGSLLGLIVALPQRGGWENIREGNLAARKSFGGTSVTRGAGWRRETDQVKQRNSQGEPRCHPSEATVA